MKKAPIGLAALAIAIAPISVLTPVAHAAPCVAGSSVTCNACLMGSQAACAALGAQPPQVAPAAPPPPPPAAPATPWTAPPLPINQPPVPDGPAPPAPPPGTSPGHGEPDFCAGARPPGTDSLCPITGLTRP
jgi:hypothetical protein